MWSAALDLPGSVMGPLSGYLSADERERAARFALVRDRSRFVAGRAFLRLLLSRHLGEGPADLRFRYGSAGKPRLDEAHGELEFNLARSEALVVCAVAPRCGGVGVDVERVRPLSDAESLARAALAPREVARLESLPEPARLRGFYEAWTRKEAYLKALGCGLGRPLDSVEVAFGPGEPPRLLHAVGDPTAAGRFSLYAFQPDPDHVGAVAVAGDGWRTRHLIWRWTE